MDVSLNESQALLRDSVDRFIRDDYAFNARRRAAAGADGFSHAHWRRFAELGWLALPFAEDNGGVGAGPVETMILMEAFGRGLVLEPYLATIVLAGGFLRHGGSAVQKARWLPGLMAGEVLGAFAHIEPQAGFNPADVATTAWPDGRGFVLSGAKNIVLNGPAADILVVPARTGGHRRDPQGISLFLVATDAPGIRRHACRTVDGFHAADIAFDHVRLEPDALIGPRDDALPLIEAVVAEATAAICAEALGAMDALNQATLDYARTRTQFGRPIGSFQVLQHRMVDMLVEYEQAKSLLLAATLALAEDRADTLRMVSALKARIGRAARFIGQQAIQLHGAMGMTDDLPVGHYVKRLTVIEALFGDTDWHIDRFATIPPRQAWPLLDREEAPLRRETA